MGRQPTRNYGSFSDDSRQFNSDCRDYIRRTESGLNTQSRILVPPHCFQSSKMGRAISIGSTLDLAMVYECEFSRRVKGYYLEPPSLSVPDPYSNKHAVLSISPDLLVLEVGRAVLVDLRSEERLQAMGRNFPWRFQRTHDGYWTCPVICSAAAKLGMTYEIQSADEMSRHLLCWANRLYPFYDRQFIVPRAKASLAREIIADRRFTTLADLRDVIAGAISEDELSALIAQSDLYVNFCEASPTEPREVFVFADRTTLEDFFSFEGTGG